MPDVTPAVTAGQVLLVIADVVPVLVRGGLLDATTGALTPLATQTEAWGAIAPEVEVAIAKFVSIPDRVDRIIKALPVLLSLI